ncbi:protein MRVI1 isoform X2 [Sinocyclocheilus anshuiensis]|nr:PREDICTED: protein MRVI1-like isoform X2 [Sinocyclocheilus anshuiensis]
MPTLPEEEEDSPEELNSTSSSPSTYAPVESMMVSVTMTPPAIVLPRQVSKQEPCPLEKARPHSPRPRLSRNSASSCPITTVDDDGHVIDLVKDQLPELQLSEEDRQKNLELLEEAKKVSDHFLQRRGRRSTCSLSESPTALSLNPTPCSSPRPSRSSSLSSPSQLGPEVTTTPPASPSIAKHLEVPSTHDQGDTSKPEQETFTRLVDWMPSDKRKVSSGPLTVRYSTAVPARDPAVVQKEKPDHHGPADKGKNSEHAAQKKEETSGCGITGVAKPVPRPTTQQAPCTAEIKTIGAFPPLMRAVSWDTVGSINMRNAAPKGEDSLSDKSRESLFKSSGYKDFPVPPGNVQKLSKLREEHKLMRNQSISSPKLPDLSETTEQERGPSSSLTSSPSEEEAKEKPDAMPNISDVMLRKLKLHRGLRGCAPPLSEKEVENAFVQLSLAFRNDNYTLESRLKQAERERNLTEENAEKELEEFKITLKNTVSLWQNIEQREFYQHLLETIAVLYRLTNRLSSRAEMVGAVRQEKRMNKATEVMMQYVENLKRTYEKDHAELMEFKKVASQNSSRCYAGSVDTGEDGVPRTSRSMSVQMGKALPRRRVSVAVVPKFNLLNIPGQTPASAGPNAGPLPVVCEANTIKNSSSSDPTQQDVPDKSSGNPLTEQESEATPTKVVCSPEKITEEIKAKIEEEAYNKGYQEGLKRSKELQELKEEEENAEEKPKDSEEEARGNTDKDRKTNSRFEEALEVFDRIFPKFFRGNRVLWIVLTLFFASFILVNVISFFSNRYSESGDTSAEKSAVPGKKFFGLNVGSKTPAPE